MIDKTVSMIPNHVCIVFELPASVWAHHIFVVGDFNQWCATATPMRQERDGVWRAQVDLSCGSRYEFRYLIDGRWSTDYHADDFTINLYGTGNSVVEASLPDELLILARTSSQVCDNAWCNMSPATTSRQYQESTSYIDDLKQA